MHRIDSLNQVVENCCQTIFFASFFASAHGIVSSIYLLQRLNKVNTSVIASATRSLSIFSFTFRGYLREQLLSGHHQPASTTPLLFYHTAEIFVGHGNCTVYKISKDVCQVRVHTLYHQLPGDHAVILKWHFMKHKVAHCIYTEELNQLICIDYIVLWIYSSYHHPEAAMDDRIPVSERQIQRHQEDRPVNRMETNNVFTDQMQICRPVVC